MVMEAELAPRCPVIQYKPVGSIYPLEFEFKNSNFHSIRDRNFTRQDRAHFCSVGTFVADFDSIKNRLFLLGKPFSSGIGGKKKPT